MNRKPVFEKNSICTNLRGGIHELGRPDAITGRCNGAAWAKGVRYLVVFAESKWMSGAFHRYNFHHR